MSVSLSDITAVYNKQIKRLIVKKILQIIVCSPKDIFKKRILDAQPPRKTRIILILFDNFYNNLRQQHTLTS